MIDTFDKIKMTSNMPSYPTEENINKNKQWPQWLAVISASFSFFSAGIVFGWSSPSLAILQSPDSPFEVTNAQASWIASFLPIGCAVGPIIGSYLSRYLGPKHSTVVSAFPYLAGFVLIIFANSPTWLYISRFLSGIGVGFGQTATPIYVAEIAENHNRGALMSFFLLSMGLGALFVSCVGPYVSIRVMAEISSLFPVILLASILFMPDSPYFLTRLGKEKKAEKSIKWLRRQKNPIAVEEEMKVIRKIANDNLSFTECCKQLKELPNPKALAIINVSFITQQVCGAVVIMFYQEQIYSLAGSPFSPALAVIVSSVIGNMVGVLVMFFIDRWGRRPLILLSSLGCAASTGILGTYLFLYERHYLEDFPNLDWVPFIMLNALQVFFAFGLSPVPSTQLGEMFSSNVKELAFCMLSVLTAVEGFVMVKLYQVVNDNFGVVAVFWGLSGMTLIMAFILYWVTPETKGKSFLEIQNFLSSPKDKPTEDFKLQENVNRY